MPYSTDVLLNDFVIRSFRDIADGDYIVARQQFRQRLIQQALWSGLQAIEKYLKCILVLNRVSSKNLGHNILDALKSVRMTVKFDIRLTPAAEEFIEYLDNYGKYRYYEISYHSFGRETILLDHTVWRIRRYCSVLDYSQKDASGKDVSKLTAELDRIVHAEKEPFQRFRIEGGYLEKIIDDPKHPARAALIRHNGFFGKSRRKMVQVPHDINFGNAPLALHPAILDEVLKYVWVPKEAINAYRAQAAAKAAAPAKKK